MRQIQFQKTNWDHRFSYGGHLRNKRVGRRERPLSSRDPIHLVFKANRDSIAGGFRTPRRFRLLHTLFDRYSKRFFIKIEAMTIQNDHIHLVVRISRRSNFQNFLRVVSGQAAQQFMREGLLAVGTVTDTPAQGTATRRLVTDTPGGRKRDGEKRGRARRLGKKGKLWSQRPFTRVTRARRAYRVLQDYVRLNELEARGTIDYRRDRLRNLSSTEREYFESLASKLRAEKGRVAI